MSSIYQTIISIYNLTRRQIYYDNDLVNIFLLKMDGSIKDRLDYHFEEVKDKVCVQRGGKAAFLKIFYNILKDKFLINDNLQKNVELNDIDMLESIIEYIIQQKFE